MLWITVALALEGLREEISRLEGYICKESVSGMRVKISSRYFNPYAAGC